MHWNLGKLLFDKKIESKHGSGVVNRLSSDLKEQYPDMGLSPRNLRNMKRFYEREKDEINAKGWDAILKMGKQAEEAGIQDMSLEEINAIIKEVLLPGLE